MGCLMILVFFLIYFPALIFVRGWAIATVWNWYIPVIFKGSPSLSLAAALGFATLIGMFSSSSSSSKKSEDDTKYTVWVNLATPFVWTALSVFFAWLYRHWL